MLPPIWVEAFPNMQEEPLPLRPGCLLTSLLAWLWVCTFWWPYAWRRNLRYGWLLSDHWPSLEYIPILPCSLLDQIRIVSIRACQSLWCDMTIIFHVAVPLTSLFLIHLLDEYKAHRLICNLEEDEYWRFYSQANENMMRCAEGSYLREINVVFCSTLAPLFFLHGGREKESLVAHTWEEAGHSGKVICKLFHFLEVVGASHIDDSLELVWINFSAPSSWPFTQGTSWLEH